MGRNTTTQLDAMETSKVSATAHIDDALADTHTRVTAKAIAIVFAINCSYVAMLYNVVGSGALARNISAVVGGSTETVWFTTAITIGTAILSPPVCQAADYWGRKWFTVFLTASGFVGSIVIARADSIGMAIAGFAITSISYGAFGLVHAISSEVLPRKYRPYGQAAVQFSGASSGIVALMSGGALTRNGNNEGFRTYWYISAGIYVVASLICAVLYNPPKRQLELEFTNSQKLRKLDWTAYFLLTVGLITFCMGLSWSQNPYSWKDAHVVAPFVIGIVVLIALGIWSGVLHREGMIHHKLFQHRNFALSAVCLFTEGLVFFSVNGYFAFEISVLSTSDPVLIGGDFSVLFVGIIIGAGLGGLYSKLTRTVRLPSVVAFLLVVIFYICMATIKLSTPHSNLWGYPILCGFGIGLLIAVLTMTAQFATPPELISTTTGAIVCLRNVGGTIGLAVFNAIFHHGFAQNLAPKIASAVLPLGLPTTSLGALIAALAADDEAAIAKVPHITPAIIGAGVTALKETYVISFRDVWITAAAISAAALVCSFFLFDPKDQFNNLVDAPVHAVPVEKQIEMS